MTLTIKTYGRATRAMWITAVLLTAAPFAHSATGQKEMTAAANVAAETPSQAEARSILMKMANFLASTQTFSVSCAAATTPCKHPDRKSSSVNTVRLP